MLRPYFLHHREFLGSLCRAALETVRAMIEAAGRAEIQPGMVAVAILLGPPPIAGCLDP
jgi:peptidyl-tRNA hydrolase